MTKIYGCRLNAPALALQFLGGQLPDDRRDAAYVIKALPAGVILQNGSLFWESTGAGSVKRIDQPQPGTYKDSVL